MKKRIMASMLMVSMVFGLAACGGSSSSSSSSSSNDSSSSSSSSATSSSSTATESSDTTDENVTLRFYNYALSETAKADWWTNVIASFEAENPTIDIETITVDYNSMVSTFTNDIASGLSVDMVYGEVSWVPALADAGFIQAPSNVLSADFYDGYYDHVMDQFQYNGEYFGVPHYYTNSVIFVNHELLEAAGLDAKNYPITQSGLQSWIDTLSDYYNGDTNVSTIFGMATSEVPATGANINALYTAFGGTLINEDGSLADLHSPENKLALEEMLEFYSSLINDGHTQENLKLKDYRSAFGAGNICMYVDSSWGYAQITEVDPTRTGEFTSTMPLPTTLGTNGSGDSLVESHCFLFGAVMSDAQKAATDKFVQYCTSSDVMEGYLNDIGLAFVAHENMADCAVSPILEGAIEGESNVVGQTQIPAIASVQTELATMVLNYAINGMSADDAINNYIDQANYYINQ